MEGERAFGVVYPLITNSSGTKFGKSEAGAVWLDPALTSPFRFYQYWINVEDGDAIRYLKFFSLLSLDEILDLEEAVETEPWKRAAQRALAEDVTRRLHGESGLASAERATKALFSGEIAGLAVDEIADVFSDIPSSQVDAPDLEGEGVSLADLLVSCDLASSKGDARRSIEGGGVYVNSERVDDTAASVTSTQAIEGRFVLLRKGKKNYHLVAIRR